MSRTYRNVKYANCNAKQLAGEHQQKKAEASAYDQLRQCGARIRGRVAARGRGAKGVMPNRYDDVRVSAYDEVDYGQHDALLLEGGRYEGRYLVQHSADCSPFWSHYGWGDCPCCGGYFRTHAYVRHRGVIEFRPGQLPPWFRLARRRKPPILRRHVTPLPMIGAW